MSELDQAKVSLYHKLLLLDAASMTDTDVELLALLARDPAIQNIFTAALKKG
jgi:hypothetical protein